MTYKTKVALLYTCVAIICVAVIGAGIFLRSRMPKPDISKIVTNVGKDHTESFFAIDKDISGTNQKGENVKLSNLRGKVFLVAEFFAVCPHCAVRNGAELGELAATFKDNPDFHIVCISVDPENDNVAHLADYAEALGADSQQWWFINTGDITSTHDYLEHTLKFFGIRERSDPAEIEAQGRFQHDLGFLLVDKNFNVVGKWPLPEARSPEATERDPSLYPRLKAELYNRIRLELAK